MGGGYHTKFSVLLWAKALVLAWPKLNNKHTNSILTGIRVGKSELNQHKFTIGLVESPECLCHSKEESPKHYFIDCFLYTQERESLHTPI